MTRPEHAPESSRAGHDRKAGETLEAPHRFDRPRLASGLAALLALAGEARGQELGPIQEELRRSRAENHFAASFAGLILLSDELELSTARFDFDNDVDTELFSIALPFHSTLRPWGDDGPDLYVEGVVGYASADERADDLYGGMAPGMETAVDATWTTYGGLVGAGPQFALREALTLATILNVGQARIESDADSA